jgi:predicted NUDIX family NTP pyrophosphohydrolase
MPKISAGILMYRIRGGLLQVLLVHPGGPFWKNKDEGAWSIPKGEVGSGEDLLACARREFEEETGQKIEGDLLELAPIRQKGGKIVHAWAVKGDCDLAGIHSNIAKIEWPPRSGRFVEFPEIDRAEWFEPAMARRKINPAQALLIDELMRLVAETK